MRPAFGCIVCSAEISVAPRDNFRHWKIFCLNVITRRNRTQTNKAKPLTGFGSTLLIFVRTLVHVIVRIALCKCCF